MSSDDDKKKKPSYRAPENYSQYGRPGTNDPGSSTAPKTINLGKLPLRVGDLSPGAKSDFAARFGGKGAVSEPAKNRHAPPARKAPAKSSGPSKAVYSGGLNDPKVQEAIPSSSSSAAKRLVYSEGPNTPVWTDAQRKLATQKSESEKLAGGGGSDKGTRGVTGSFQLPAITVKGSTKTAKASSPDRGERGEPITQKKTAKKPNKHSYSVRYAKD